MRPVTAIAAFGLVLAYGFWLAAQPQPVTGFDSSWVCASGKSPICVKTIQR